MSRLIPLVLDNDTLADGEKAFLLTIDSITAGGPIPFYAQPLPGRASRMRAAILIQYNQDGDPPDQSISFVVRSPFPSNQGLAVAAPIVSVSLLDTASIVMPFVSPAVPSTGAPVNWPAAPASLDSPPNYSAMYFGKNIPCWAYNINFGATPVPQSVLLKIDFAHSIT